MNINIIMNGKMSVIKYSEALKIAKNKKMDLFLIKDRIYKLVKSKFIYKKKTKKNINKEIKFNFNISNNDLNIKVKKIKNFIKKKYNTKISILTKGREIFKTELILKIVKNIKGKLINKNIIFTNLKKNANVFSFNITYKK
ncbi:hypothetical protein ACT2CC_00510 [Candidatus Vidania fulgoroideorum]